jgi:hypothetical protein
MKEGTPSFETLDQAIRNISKNIDVATKKSWTQQWKKLEVNPKKRKAVTKAIRKEVMKKRTPIIESSSSFDNEVSLPPLENCILC